MSQGFANAPGMLREPGSGAGSLRDLPTLGDVDLGSASFDYRKEIEKMASEAKGGGGSRIHLDLNLPPVLTGLVSADALDIDAILLQQARQHVSKREFVAALEKLDQFVRKQPRHPEACYLRAVCILNIDNALESLDEEIAALEALLPLGGAPLGRELAERVEMLKAAIRRKVFGEFPIHLLARERQELFADVERLLTLDPQGAIYHAFKAIILAEAGALPTAYDCVEAGIAVAGRTVPPLLGGLRASLLQQLLRGAFAPAIQHYKRGDYDRARKAVSRVDERFASTREHEIFSAHLKKLGGTGFLGLSFGRKKTVDLAVDGAVHDRERLYALIVAEEMDAANAYLRIGNFAEAEGALREALRYAPDYPMACYLSAGCRFRRLHDRLTTGSGTDIDTAIAELHSCARLTEIGRRDPEISGAESLMRQIRGMSSFFEQMKSEMQQRQAEVRKVNSAIQEFVSIMDLAKRGIDSVQTFESILRRMTALKTSLRPLRDEVTDKDGKEALRQLEGAVERNLEDLRRMNDDIAEQKKEADVVNEAGRRFRKILEGVGSGIGSESQLASIESELGDLKRDFRGYRQRLKSEPGKKALTEVEEAVDGNLTEVQKLKVSLAEQKKDKGVVDEQGEAFAAIGKRLSSGDAFGSRGDLSAFRTRIHNAKSSAEAARSKVGSMGAKSALAQMVAQYDQILQQIDRSL